VDPKLSSTEDGAITIILRPQGEVAARFERGRDRLPITTRRGTTIADLLSGLGIPAGEIWICARNGTLAHPTDTLEDGDTLEVISPVAGGELRVKSEDGNQTLNS